jgi:catechol 2,3-dioxygenase-like lactoylglutathione lyase family enzyme
MDLSRVIIFTPDVERLVSFYRSTFGLDLLDGGDSKWTGLSAGSCNIAFHHIDEFSNFRDGWVKLVFESANVADEKQRLHELGIETSDIVEFDDVQLCDGRDPDGNFFQISSRTR